MEAIILAGGLGTRLKSVIPNLPKPMAPIGDKPFLEYLLYYLKNNSIKKVTLSVGYNWDIIKKYFGNSFQGLELIYSVEKTQLGTGGAIKKALEFIDDETVFVFNGDTYFDIDLNKLTIKKNSKLVLALKKLNDFDRYGEVIVSSKGVVVGFVEKKYCKKGNINGGIYLIRKNIFNGVSLDKRFSFENFIENNFNKLNTFAKVFDDYFIDIGIPEDYKKACEHLTI